MKKFLKKKKDAVKSVLDRSQENAMFKTAYTSVYPAESEGVCSVCGARYSKPVISISGAAYPRLSDMFCPKHVKDFKKWAAEKEALDSATREKLRRKYAYHMMYDAIGNRYEV